MLLAVIIYIVFNIFWGLNYNRKGIAWQLIFLQLIIMIRILNTIQQLLLQKVNETKQNCLMTKQQYPENSELFEQRKRMLRYCKKKYPFITYQRTVREIFSLWIGLEII